MLRSLLVDIIEAPVVVVVGRGAVRGEVVLDSASIVDVGKEYLSNFVAVFEKHVNTIVVAKEFGYLEGKGIDFIRSLVNPVV